MVLDAAVQVAQFIVAKFTTLFLALGSNFSVLSLFSALCIAVVFLLLRRRSGRKQVKYKVMGRALFPRWLRRASFKADVGFLLLNVLGSAALYGWAMLSSQIVSHTLGDVLTGAFGVLP